MSRDEKFCLKWNDFQKNITTSYKELRESADFSDVTLVCEEEHQVEAHRFILSASSPFFMNILKKNDHSHPLIYMRGLKAKDLTAIVDFIYHGEANILQDDLDDFLALAEELQLKGLAGDKGKEGSKEQTSKEESMLLFENKEESIQILDNKEPILILPKEEPTQIVVKNEPLQIHVKENHSNTKKFVPRKKSIQKNDKNSVQENQPILNPLNDLKEALSFEHGNISAINKSKTSIVAVEQSDEDINSKIERIEEGRWQGGWKCNVCGKNMEFKNKDKMLKHVKKTHI